MTHVLTTEFMKELRKRILADGSNFKILDQLIELRGLYQTLCGFISNMSFVADKQSHDSVLYAMNTT